MDITTVELISIVDLMVECQPSKLNVGVRFPHGAPLTHSFSIYFNLLFCCNGYGVPCKNADTESYPNGEGDCLLNS